MSVPMESWRRSWRLGFLPSLPVDGLRVLLTALEGDDRRLLQGATTAPPPLQCVFDWPVEAGDPVVLAFWRFQPSTTVGEAEEFFARTCYDADQHLGEPAGSRWLLNWWDETPRPTALRLLAEEVRQNLRDLALQQMTEAPVDAALSPASPPSLYKYDGVELDLSDPPSEGSGDVHGS